MPQILFRYYDIKRETPQVLLSSMCMFKFIPYLELFGQIFAPVNAWRRALVAGILECFHGIVFHILQVRFSDNPLVQVGQCHIQEFNWLSRIMLKFLFDCRDDLWKWSRSRPLERFVSFLCKNFTRRDQLRWRDSFNHVESVKCFEPTHSVTFLAKIKQARNGRTTSVKYYLMTSLINMADLCK